MCLPCRAQPPFQFEKFLHELAEVSRADKWQIREVEILKYIYSCQPPGVLTLLDKSLDCI